MHNGCILCGGVGVGKSHTAVQYYLNNEAPKPVYVITTAKKRDKLDWQAIFVDVGMCEDPELTMGATVKVDSWENIAKYKEITDAFFIFDEQRLVGSGAWVKAFYKIAEANRWIMLSATPGDNWLDYVPVFRANGFIKNLTAFKEDHVLSRWTGRYYQVTGYRQVSRLVRWRNSLLVDMPYEKHTKRHTHYVDVQYDKDLVKELVTKRWHVYEERPLTDASELFRVTRKVVYSDTSRLNAVRSLLQTHPKLIVFYNFDYELEILRTLANESTKKETPSIELLEKTPHESSSTQISDTSASTRSPTHSGSESASTQRNPATPSISSMEEERLSNGSSKTSTTEEAERSSEQTSTPTGPWTDPWESLLSPEGLRENERLISEIKRFSRSTTSQTNSGQTEHSSSSMRSSGASRKRTGVSTATRSDGFLKSLPQDPTTQPHTTTGHWTSDHGQGEIWVEGNCPTKETLRTRQSSSSASTDTTSCSIEQSSTQTKTRNDDSETCATTNSDVSNESWEETDECQTRSSDHPTSVRKTSQSSVSATDTSSDKSSSDSTTDSPRKSITLDSLKLSSDILARSWTGSGYGPTQPFQVAEWNGHKHEELPTTTSWVYLVQYVAGAEAWESTDTDAIVFYSMPYSYKIWWQAHGRIDRLTTKFLDLHYYILWANSYLEKGVKASLRDKKSFNESAFAVENGLW